MDYIEYDTTTGVIVENFKTPSELHRKSPCTVENVSSPEPDGPISYRWAKEIMCNVVAGAYCDAWKIATDYRHQYITPLALFIALWNEDKELISYFLSFLKLNHSVLMSDVLERFNGEPKYLPGENYSHPPRYNNYEKEAEVAKNLANQMCLKRANSLCIIWSFIIHNNEFGQILCNQKHLTNKDIHEAFVYALSMHMKYHLKNIDDCKKWPLFSEMCLLEFGENDVQNSHIDVGRIIQRQHFKDLKDYMHSVTTRIFFIFCEAEKMCRERKYKSITPHVIFAAMTVYEKDFLLKALSEYKMDFNDICRKCEQEMEKLQGDDGEAEGELSESVQELLSSAMEDVRWSPNGVINVDSLFFAIILCSEMSSVFEGTAVDVSKSYNDLSWYIHDFVNDVDLYLEYDAEIGVFLRRIKNRSEDEGFDLDEKTGGLVDLEELNDVSSNKESWGWGLYFDYEAMEFKCYKRKVITDGNDSTIDAEGRNLLNHNNDNV